MTDTQIIAAVRVRAISDAGKNLESASSYLFGVKNTLIKAYEDGHYLVATSAELATKVGKLLEEVREEFDRQSNLTKES